jgi:2-phospho-L-lactate guanylyltransferase
VKELSKAKQRLTAHFSPVARIELADALWQDFFNVAAAARNVDKVFVVSAELRVLDRARRFAWEVIPESRQVSESDSVDFASRWCVEHGVDALLRLPADLPLIQSCDIESLFSGLPSGSATVIAPSRDGDGTNALLRKPPTLFPSRFGPGSFAKHLAEASRVGSQIRVVRNPRIEVDIDDVDDLRLLSAQDLRPNATRTWLQSHGFVPATEEPVIASEVPRA